MTNQHCRNELCSSSGETIHGSWDGVGAVGSQDLFVFGCHSSEVGVPRDVRDKDGFVINEVSSQTFIGPPVHQGLQSCVLRPSVGKINQKWLLHIVGQVATSLDLSIPVVKGSALRVVPERVHKVHHLGH